MWRCCCKIFSQFCKLSFPLHNTNLQKKWQVWKDHHNFHRRSTHMRGWRQGDCPICSQDCVQDWEASTRDGGTMSLSGTLHLKKLLPAFLLFVWSWLPSLCNCFRMKKAQCHGRFLQSQLLRVVQVNISDEDSNHSVKDFLTYLTMKAKPYIWWQS